MENLGKAATLGKLDQVPEPRVTYFRRDQVELGYRGPAGPGSGMFNMGNTCYLNSTLQVIGYSCVVNIESLSTHFSGTFSHSCPGKLLEVWRAYGSMHHERLLLLHNLHHEDNTQG